MPAYVKLTVTLTAQAQDRKDITEELNQALDLIGAEYIIHGGVVTYEPTDPPKDESMGYETDSPVAEDLAEVEKLMADDLWKEHPVYLRGDWQDEVAQSSTQLGYWDWMKHAIKRDKEDEE